MEVQSNDGNCLFVNQFVITVERFAMSVPEFIELSPAEVSREYTFPCGAKVKIDEVAKIAVSNSGTHRLETKSGRKHIVPTGWIQIEIDAAAWTF